MQGTCAELAWLDGVSTHAQRVARHSLRALDGANGEFEDGTHLAVEAADAPGAQGALDGHDAVLLADIDHVLRHLLERIGPRAGVEYCHPHAFRRTLALFSLRNGMSNYHPPRSQG